MDELETLRARLAEYQAREAIQQAGERAARTGQGMSACPYTQPSEASLWLMGWRYVYLQALCQYLRAALQLIERHYGRELIAPNIVIDEAARIHHFPNTVWDVIASTYSVSMASLITWELFDGAPADTRELSSP